MLTWRRKPAISGSENLEPRENLQEEEEEEEKKTRRRRGREEEDEDEGP